MSSRPAWPCSETLSQKAKQNKKELLYCISQALIAITTNYYLIIHVFATEYLKKIFSIHA
jgi:hypothetical protein